MIFLILILYAVACYVFLFINSGLKLLYRKLAKESKKWTFKDAIRSWGFDGDYEMITEKEKKLGVTSYWREEFSGGLFAFMFFVSPFWFLWEFFKLLTRLVITPILHFLGEN